MKKTLSFLFALVYASSLFASDTQVNGIWYDFDSSTKTASVTYKGSSYSSLNNEYSGSVVIPEKVSYNGITYSVTTIGEYAFRECSSLTSITIPNSVTTIEVYAFGWCYNLALVTIPNSVTTIGMMAFCGCKSLTSVTIPNSVTTIEEYAFEHCEKLASITIGSSVITIGVRAFANCYKLTSVTIPNSVTTIEEYAFERCISLTSVTIGSSVKTIGGCAFYLCTGLTSVTIGNSVTSIGKSAFENCYCLTSVTIPNFVTTIGDYAFRGCRGLTSVTIPNSVTTIGNGAFLDCYRLTSITCYAVAPPKCVYDYFHNNAFYDISQDAIVYVPASALADYQNAEVWKDLQLYPIAADVTPMDDENPIVTPTDQDVTITWPITDGTDTYTLTISQNGKTVCVLTFNAQGQLTNIAFAAPGHNGARQAPAATLTAQGYQFTVTGLDPGTSYEYSVTAINAGGKTIAEHKGNFSTTGGGTPTSVDEVHGSQPTPKGLMHKVLRNGQLLIETHNATYTPLGQKVK